MGAQTVKRDSIPLRPADREREAESGPRVTDAQVETLTRRSRRSGRRYYNGEKVRILKLALGAVAFLFFIFVLLTWIYVANRSAEADRALLESQKYEAELALAKDELVRLRSEKDVLVKGRIPKLRELKYDQAIPISEKYVRNIIFTLIRTAKETSYEYRVVLNNNKLTAVLPDVNILLFDDRGIQIGMAKIKKSDATTKTERATLDPGEIRSYSAAIHLTADEKPRYFLLRVN